MIGLCCPTHKRPERLAHMLDSLRSSTGKPEDVHLVAAIDADDPCLTDYERVMASCPVSSSTLIGDFNTSVKGWNSAAVEAARMGATVLHMTADDLEFRDGWDEHVRAVAETLDGPWIMHYRDDYRDEARVCNPFVSRAYYDGYGFLPTTVAHFHSDEWLECMGRLSGCLVYSPSLHIRHNHPKEGRASWDETYLNPRSPKRRAADASAWEGLQELLRHESAKLLRETKPSFRSVLECGSQRSPSPSPSEPAPQSPPKKSA